eukprot:COSAG02_NODE_481_length_21461_cov_43.885597_17_plen_750_part_00
MKHTRRGLESSAVKTDIVLPHLPNDKRTRVGGGFEHAPYTDRVTERFAHINQSPPRRSAPVEDPIAESPPRVGGGFRLSPRSPDVADFHQEPQMEYQGLWEFKVESKFFEEIKKFTMRREDVTLAGLRSKLKIQHQGKLPWDFVVRTESGLQELATDQELKKALAEPANNPLRLVLSKRERSSLEQWIGLSVYKEIRPVLEELEVNEPDDLTTLWPEQLEQIKAKMKNPTQVAAFKKKFDALTKKPKKKKGSSRQVQKLQPQAHVQDTAAYSKRVGGGFDYKHKYAGLTDDDEPDPEISSPNRRARNGLARSFGRRRTTISWQPNRTSGKGAESVLCERPVTVGKCAMWFLIVHCSLEIWGALSAFRDWFACNFYPEYTDLMWDVLCGVFVAIAAAFVVASTVGCECICCTVVRSSEKLAVTRGSNWPKYLYTIACLSAIAAAVFGAHPAVVSNDPFMEEASVRRGLPNGPDSRMEGSGINEGRRRLAETADPPCTIEADEPVPWCVLSTAKHPYEQDISATNNCTDVMKYAGCADGVIDDNCAEEKPYPSWRVLAESGGGQPACMNMNSVQLCKYEFSRIREAVPCPPEPPPPPPTHGYTIVRCVEAVWTARVLVMAMICRVIGAIGAGLFSLRVCAIALDTYKDSGPNGATTDELEGAPTLGPQDKFGAPSARLGAANDVQTELSFAQLEGRSSPTQGAAQPATRPENFSPAVDFSPISNRSENQWSDTPARLMPEPEPESGYFHHV